MNKIREMNSQEFVDYVKLKYNLYSLKDVSKHYGLSDSRVSQWLNKNKIPSKYLKIEIEKISSSKIQSKIENVGFNSSHYKMLIGLQQEKINELENQISVDVIGNELWNNINPDFEYTIKVKFLFKQLDVKKKFTHVGELTPLSNYTGYSIQKLKSFYSTGAWFDSVVGGTDKLYTKNTNARLKNISSITVRAIGILKAMIGYHYITIPLTYITKEGKRKKAISYNKLNIKARKGYAKIVFI